MDRGVAVWSTPEWRESVVAWLDDRLADSGVVRTGGVEQLRVRPWATVLSVPTIHGNVWFKACGHGTDSEVGLYVLLNRVVPNRVLEPIAADVERGWILLPDGGPTLADRCIGPDVIDALVTVMPQYGQMQRDLGSYVAEMLALGVTDMRPGAMPLRFVEALAAVHGYVERHGTTEDRATYERLGKMGGTIGDWCAQLAGTPGQPSLDHNDLYPENVLVSLTNSDERARFYDWGDSVVAHPFASMLVLLGFARRRINARFDDPRLLRVRDAYLEAFSDLAPHTELVEALELACQVGKIARSLVWQRAAQSMDDEDAVDYAAMPFVALVSVLNDTYLSSNAI